MTADAFANLAPGATLESTFDLATVTDLKAGGAFDVVAEGAFALAGADSTSLSDSKVYYRSNTLSITVDGAYAASVAPAIHVLDQRTVETSCSGAQQTSLTNALSNVVRLSNAAATAATSGSASKFNEYFKTTATSARNTVSARLQGVAAQAGSTNSGSTTYYCTDPYGYCDPNVLAYSKYPSTTSSKSRVRELFNRTLLKFLNANTHITFSALPSQNLIANCGIYYSELPLLTTTCHAQDQTTTSLHEFTHAPATYSPGTADNAYGYAASTALSSSQAILNADTYALYANAIYVGC